MSEYPVRQVTPVRASVVISPEQRYRELVKELEANPHSCRWRNEAVSLAVRKTQEEFRYQMEMTTASAKQAVERAKRSEEVRCASEFRSAVITASLIRYGAYAMMFLLFLTMVWPGLYRYEHQGNLLVRINRITSDTEQMWQGQWHPVRTAR